MGIDSHLSTYVGTQSPKYLEMAQGHISLSDHYTKYLLIYLLVCMFACSCCIVIGAFVPSCEGQFYKSTLDSGARSQFRELSPFRRLKHDKLTGSL
jgi:hypothetical protein